MAVRMVACGRTKRRKLSAQPKPLQGEVQLAGESRVADPSASLVGRPAVCPQGLASLLAVSCLLPMLRLALKPTGYGSSLLALGENSQVWVYVLSGG